MIYIGTDIVPINRIESLIITKGDRFLSYIFTDLERKICNDKINPPIHYSGKFAAKEAVKKALLSAKITTSITFRSIEIINDGSGVPLINLKIDKIKFNDIKVSISHAGEYATASAIVVI